ncbi:GH25 family lysozyme [Lactiplantibacillus daowaiensis]|uniref:GH25 family lysozyme n=1 Tax=Lactiplantibacillus daowaiensis TaxID=2559918 RepID=A0ABW1RXN3_9LACO|nr:GH25 family lysozyme [Lactiplantibacillus daowaiensis]
MKAHNFKPVVRGLALTALVTLGFGVAAAKTASADTTKAIPDISEWQGQLTATEVQNMKNNVSFVINRRQYGSDYIDKYATNNTNLYVKYGVPFGEYAYAQFVSASDAKQEAKDFYNRSNKNAAFYVLDFEVNTVTSGTTNAAVKAWYDEMRSLTNKKLIFYSYQSFATTYANTARQSFDAQWIANYSSTPTISYALWQYTDNYYMSALDQYIDNSKAVVSVHPISWWTAAGSVAGSTTDTSTSTNTNTNTSTTTTTPTAYSKYKVGQHAYLHKAATTYYGTSTTIPSSAKQKFYKITAVKSVTSGNSAQAVYLSGLNQWVLAQDVTGYWYGQHGSFDLTSNLNIYADAGLKTKTGSKYTKGSQIKGTVITNGNVRRIKTSKGYVSANVKYATPAYFESLPSSKTVTVKKKIYGYSKSSLKKAYRQNSLAKGTKVTVTKVGKRSTGSRYFVTAAGQYITANKSYVTN